MPHNVKFNEPDLKEDYAALKCEIYFEELLRNLDLLKQFLVQHQKQTENITRNSIITRRKELIWSKYLMEVIPSCW